VLALGSARASAQGREDTERAKTYFLAGAEAFGAAQYLVAAEAFLKANALRPSPALEFSAAQAYRMQFFIGRSPEHLRLALELYRSYLAKVPTGKRRAEAVQGLAQLGPHEALLDGAGGASSAKPTTRVLVSSRAPDAVVSLDGGPWTRSPLVAEVSPGRHAVVVRAPGHHEVSDAVLAVRDDLVALHVPLEPMPARVQVDGAEGGELYVDGKRLATLPSAEPVEIGEGNRFVAVGLNGHLPYAQELFLERGSLTDIDLELPTTGQRRASYGLFGASAAGAVATGVLAAMAFAAEDKAEDIDAQREAAGIDAAQRDEYNSAIERRDDLVLAAGIGGGATAALLLAGLGLYMFDEPDLSQPTAKPVKAPKASDAPEASEQVGLAVGPGLVGLGVGGRF